MEFSRRLAGSGLALVLIIPVASAAAPIPVKVVAVRAVDAPAEVTVSSTVMVEHEMGVSTRVSGVIDSIQADRGDVVRKDQPLATLDQREFDLDRRDAEEAFRVAESDYKRYQELAAQKLASKAELEQREARFEAAKVQLDRARLTLDRSVIRAPFDGVVVDRLARVGQKVLVEENVALFRISSTEPFLARAYLPEAWLNRLKPGARVRIVATEFPDSAASGDLTFLSPVIDPGSASFLVTVKIPREGSPIFRSGLSVRLTFRSNFRALELPASCLVDRPAAGVNAGRVLELVGGRLVTRDVRFESADTGRILVRSGLGTNARVVLEPSLSMRDGTPALVAP